MDEELHSVGDILNKLEELSGKQERISLGDTVEAMGSRSYGPFLIVPALIEISPIGGIPAVPTFLAALVILFAAQMLLGRRHLWLPGFLARLGVSSRKMLKAIEKLRPLARRMDRWFHNRLPVLTSRPFMRLAAGTSIVLALAVPPLELIPFASTAPMIAIAAFGLALLVRDGLLMIVAMLLAAGAVAAGMILFVSRG